MRNPDCVFAPSCLNYAENRCEGCGKATSKRAEVKRDDSVYAHMVRLIENSKYGAFSSSNYSFAIKNVIFNDPATIVFWKDNTKTVVKCENEEYDPEKGLAMAMVKKMLGNKGNYYNVIKKWLPKEEPKQRNVTHEPLDPRLGQAIKDYFEDLRPWRIWFRKYENGKLIGSGTWLTDYKRKNDATRVAKKRFGDSEKYEFIVSKTNPWSKEEE